MPSIQKILAQTKFMNKLFLSIFVLFSLLAASCKKDPAVAAVSTNPWDTISNYSGIIVPVNGKLYFNFTYHFATQPLVFGNKYYVNAAQDTFNINELKHYFTNVSLQKPNGDWINLKNYHLLDAKTPSSCTLEMNNVPAGNYTRLSFLLGIDSITNYGGVQDGALDPAWGMFWTWNTGYIFYRINGQTASGKSYSYDLGGINNLPKITLDLQSFKLKSQAPKFYMSMDINEMFQNPSNFSMAINGYVIHDVIASEGLILKNNMEDMVSISKIDQ